MDTTKESKGGSFIRMTASEVLLAGIIIFSTGIYYCVIKAGIPYQDPPLELQIQYTINWEIGNIMVKEGFLLSICGGIAGLLYKLILKKRRKK